MKGSRVEAPSPVAGRSGQKPPWYDVGRPTRCSRNVGWQNPQRALTPWDPAPRQHGGKALVRAALAWLQGNRGAF